MWRRQTLQHAALDGKLQVQRAAARGGSLHATAALSAVDCLTQLHRSGSRCFCTAFVLAAEQDSFKMALAVRASWLPLGVKNYSLGMPRPCSPARANQARCGEAGADDATLLGFGLCYRV